MYFFLAIVILIKGLCVMMQMLINKIRISRNVILFLFFLKNQYFFLSRHNLVSSSISLPSFDDVFSIPSRFKTGLVY